MLYKGITMKKIAFAGSFDPITNGHLWVIEEALQIAEEVVVFIASNSQKVSYFSIEEKKSMIRASLEERGIGSRVTIVVLKNEYAAYSALQAGCDYSIRGIRSAADFDYESLIQQTNRDILMGTKTLFVMPPRDLESVSSSFIKSLIGPPGWHWHIKELVSQPVYLALMKKYVTRMVCNYMGLLISEDEKKKFVDQLFTHYGDNRFYHNIEHIVHTFQELEWAIANHNIPDSIYQDVALALAGHDIVMGAKDSQFSDEELSAQWMEQWLESHGLVRPDIGPMILSTQHLSGKYTLTTEKEKLINSIDLAILAQNDKVYNWYTIGVRQEYSFVSDNDFNIGRLSALETLLNKTLFPSAYLAHYEIKAKNNIKKEIKVLEANSSMRVLT